MAAIRAKPWDFEQIAMGNRRIFGIGLSKTGTTSLSRALQILGYRTNHFPYSAIRYDSGNLSLNLERIRQWDAATDSPVALFFKRLEKNFPDAKFILTQRDVDSWIASCRHNHVWPGDYVRNRSIRRLPHVRKILCLHRKVYGSERFHAESFRKAYEGHCEAVVEHFSGKGKNLLVVDICAGQGWEPLCDFLGVPVPAVPFPRENVGEFKRLKKMSRRAGWQFLSMLPTRRLTERRVEQIIASGANSD